MTEEVVNTLQEKVTITKSTDYMTTAMFSKPNIFYNSEVCPSSSKGNKMCSYLNLHVKFNGKAAKSDLYFRKRNNINKTRQNKTVHIEITGKGDSHHFSFLSKSFPKILFQHFPVWEF